MATGDPDRPDPSRSAEAWYAFHRAAFLHPRAVLISDRDHLHYQFALQESSLQDQLQLLSQVVDFRNRLALIHLDHPAIPLDWEQLGRQARENVLLEALVFVAIEHGLEHCWTYCPDVSKSRLCSGTGAGFISLVNHFLPSDPTEPPSLDVPTLFHEEVWRTFSLPKPGEEVPRPEAVKGLQNLVLARRHLFLCAVVVQTLVVMYRLATSVSYTNGVRLQKSGASEDRLVPSSSGNRRPAPEVCEQCLQPPKPPDTKFLICSTCRTIGRSVTYCSRACQVKAYNHGVPFRHRDICGIPLRSIDIATLRTPKRSFPLYTTSPSVELVRQVLFLKQGEPEVDYNFVTSEGRRWPITFLQPGVKALFRESRALAMSKRDEKSIGAMDLLMRSFESVPEGVGVEAITLQLEKEYQVGITRCREATWDSGLFVRVQETMNVDD